VPKTVPSISGSEGISTIKPYINGGNVTNTGVELELGFTKTLSGVLMNIRANMAYNKNNVNRCSQRSYPGFCQRIIQWLREFYRVQEGYPIGYFWDTKRRTFQTEEEIDSYVNAKGQLYQKNASPGDVKFVNTNGDSILNSSDKVMLGNPHPDFIYGFSLNANFKGFDFSMNIQGVAGNQIVQAYRDESRTYYNYTTEILDRWQWIDANDDGIVNAGEGTSDRIPRVYQVLTEIVTGEISAIYRLKMPDFLRSRVLTWVMILNAVLKACHCSSSEYIWLQLTC